MQLKLTVPEQHDFKDPTVELNPRRLRTWLHALPLLNRADSLSQLLHALHPLNEQKIDGQLRFRLLNLYQPIVHKLYEADANDVVNQPHETQATQQLIAQQLVQLCMAMADGYKLVLKAWFADGIPQQDPQLFARALRRAFRPLVWVMQHSYRHTAPLPEYLLFEMHQLYRLAIVFEVRSTTDISKNGQVSASLADYYRAAMLLTMVNKQRIKATHQERIFSALLHYGREVTLSAGNSWPDTAQGLYLIDLTSDHAPCNCHELVSPVQGDALQIMSVNGLIDTLHQKLASRPSEQRFSGPELVILKALAPTK